MRWVFFIFIFFLFQAISTGQNQRIDSLEAIIKLNKKDAETAKAFNFISYEYVRTDVEKAKKYLWAAKNLATFLENDRILSSTYSQLSSIHQNEAKLDSAQFYLTRLSEIAAVAKGENASVIKGNYYATAGLFYKKSGKLKEALDYFILARNIAVSNGDVVSASGQAINIGNSYLGLSDFNEALQYYLEALRGFEQTQNKKGQSFCYQNIGECYIELQRYSSALPYVNKSISLKKELNDTRGLGNAEQSLGRIYMGLEAYDKALLHYNNALTIVRDLKLSTEEVKVNLNLGKIYSQKEDKEKALSYFEKSKLLAKKLGDSSSVILADLEVLAIKEATSKIQENELNALENIQALKESGAISKEAAGYKNLAEYYANLKQYDKALEFTNLYVKLNDSIRNNEVQTQFKTIEENFNKANNEKQIALLQKDQIIYDEKLKQQRFWLVLSGLVILFISLGVWMFIHRNKLKQKMKEMELRNQLAADLHDEVGSSLSSIYMLSQMANDEQAMNQQAILKKVSNNAQETMVKMSDIVWMLKPNESTKNVIERMQRFGQEICGSKQIKFNFLVEKEAEITLTTLQNKNLYLIYKEAINNAVKYSETDTIKVSILFKTKKIQMDIKDYGKGFNQKTILKGNGLESMEKRAHEIKGTLNINSEVKQGSQITLAFPVS
ncbi:MAG: tetratricopeptide repeat protein [Flavobacteriaceae bacterium]